MCWLQALGAVPLLHSTRRAHSVSEMAASPPSSDGCSTGKPSNLCSPLSSLQMAWDLNVVWPLQLGDRSRLRKCGWEAAGDAGSAPCVSAYFLTSERRISSAARPPQAGPTGGHSSVWGGPHLSDPAQPGIFKLELPIKPGRKSSPGYWISLGYVQGPGVVPHIEIEKNLYMGCRKTSLRKAPPEMAQPCKCFEWTENLQHEYFTGKFWQAQHLSSSVSLRSWLPLPPHCAGCPLDPVNAAMALSRSVAGLAGPWHSSRSSTPPRTKKSQGRGLSTCVCGNNIPAEVQGYRDIPSLLPSSPHFLCFTAWWFPNGHSSPDRTRAVATNKISKVSPRSHQELQILKEWTFLFHDRPWHELSKLIWAKALWGQWSYSALKEPGGCNFRSFCMVISP